MLGNLSDFDAKAHSVPLDELLDVDRYILHRLKVFADQVCASVGGHSRIYDNCMDVIGRRRTFLVDRNSAAKYFLLRQITASDESSPIHRKLTYCN